MGWVGQVGDGVSGTRCTSPPPKPTPTYRNVVGHVGGHGALLQRVARALYQQDGVRHDARPHVPKVRRHVRVRHQHVQLRHAHAHQQQTRLVLQQLVLQLPQDRRLQVVHDAHHVTQRLQRARVVVNVWHGTPPCTAT